LRLARATLSPVICAVSQRLTGFGSGARNVGTAVTGENCELTQLNVSSGCWRPAWKQASAGRGTGYPPRERSEPPASPLSLCSNSVITALLQSAAPRSSGPRNGTDHRVMAGHEASLPYTAVDTVIPMTRGADKLRTVCGRVTPEDRCVRGSKRAVSSAVSPPRAPAATAAAGSSSAKLAVDTAQGWSPVCASVAPSHKWPR
jgi:hypothetical protein